MNPTGQTCLVVDDSGVVRKVARRILEKHGLKVQEAENGEAGLAICRRGLPSVVLLDWNMPIMDGLTMLQALRLEFGSDQPVVIFCTTENAISQIHKALASGAQDYMIKPFDEAMLMAKLNQVGIL